MKPRASKSRAEKCDQPLKPRQLALLRGNPHRHRPLGEFMDKQRDVSEVYYTFLEETEVKHMTIPGMKKRLRSMINADPDFLDPYLYLTELYYESGDSDSYAKTIYGAYLRALHIVADRNGHYPKRLPWGWIENRHIIRTLSNFALLQWEQGEVRLALEIYRKLLASNLSDNVGARYAILALRMGYNPDYERLFLSDAEPVYGLDAVKMDRWFDKYSKHFPKEFGTFAA